MPVTIPQRLSAGELLRIASRIDFPRACRTVDLHGHPVPHAFGDHAVLVVHGIGTQARFATGNQLSENLRKAAGPDRGAAVPFVHEGYWSPIAEGLTGASDYSPWVDRWRGALRTWRWFGRASWQLLIQDLRRARIAGALVDATRGFVGCAILGASAVFQPGRALIARVVAEVRAYIAPAADENGWAPEVDAAVRREYLALLGLTDDFDELPPAERVAINGTPVTFTQVTWLSHSLGTVISFNVLGDLLRKCEAYRVQRPQAVARVESSLRAFVTCGSPIGSIRELEERGVTAQALRAWPRSPLPQADVARRVRWFNFRNVNDPVSSGVTRAAKALAGDDAIALVTEVSTRYRWPLPVHAHLSFWNDSDLLAAIGGRAPDACEASVVRRVLAAACLAGIGIIAAAGSCALLLTLLHPGVWTTNLEQTMGKPRLPILTPEGPLQTRSRVERVRDVIVG